MGVGLITSPTNHGLVCLITSIHPVVVPRAASLEQKTLLLPRKLCVFRSTVSETGAETNINISYYTLQHLRGRVSQNLNLGWQLTAPFKVTWDLWRGPTPTGGLWAYAADLWGTAIHWLSVDLENDPDHSLLNSWKKTSQSMKNAPPVCLTSCIFPCGRWNSPENAVL